MKQPPQGWPRISSALFYDDAAAAIDWLTRTFGFEVRLKVEGEGGRIEHSELVFGEGLVMIGSTGREAKSHMKSPRAVGGANTQALCIVVDDVDAHCARARKAGAKVINEPEDQFYGDRRYGAEDPEGHHWFFATHVRDVAPEDMKAPG